MKSEKAKTLLITCNYKALHKASEQIPFAQAIPDPHIQYFSHTEVLVSHQN